MYFSLWRVCVLCSLCLCASRAGLDDLHGLGKPRKATALASELTERSPERVEVFGRTFWIFACWSIEMYWNVLKYANITKYVETYVEISKKHPKSQMHWNNLETLCRVKHSKHWHLYSRAPEQDSECFAHQAGPFHPERFADYMLQQTCSRRCRSSCLQPGNHKRIQKKDKQMDMTKFIKA